MLSDEKERILPVNDLKVSIIIPTYNRPDSLPLCLGSLEKQTVLPYEVIIVVDGGITPEVQAAIDPFKESSSLNIVQINNRGQMGAQVSRSIGLKTTSGQIVTYLDDDVTLEPDWLAEILRSYQDNTDAAGVGGIIIDPTPYLDSGLYRLFTRIRARLYHKRMGRINFIGLPYAYLAAPAAGYLSVEFLNSGNSSYYRDILVSHGPEKVMDLDYVEEHNLGTILTRHEGRKLIYNSRAVAYHHSSHTGGSWNSDRNYNTIRDHTTYLLKNFNLSYLRLAFYCIYVTGLSILFRNPKYFKAIDKGMKQYRRWQNGEI